MLAPLLCPLVGGGCIGYWVGGWFRHQLGRQYQHRCDRTFTEGTAASLACYEHGARVISVLGKQKPKNSGTTYRMAGAEIPEAVRRAVAASIDGGTFDVKKRRRRAIMGSWDLSRPTIE